MVGLSLSAAALVCSTFMDDVRPAVAAIGLASFCAMSQQANWWAVVSHISGPHLGALFGLMNSMGVAGAITSPILVGYLVEWRERAGFTGREAWDLTWWICAGVLISGAAAWRLVDIDRSLVERPVGADAAA